VADVKYGEIWLPKYPDISHHLYWLFHVNGKYLSKNIGTHSKAVKQEATLYIKINRNLWKEEDDEEKEDEDGEAENNEEEDGVDGGMPEHEDGGEVAKDAGAAQEGDGQAL